MASEKQDPRVKSLRLSIIRLADQIAGMISSETDNTVLQKLNSSLIILNIGLSIVKDDPLRASRMLSNARRLANVQVKKET